MQAIYVICKGLVFFHIDSNWYELDTIVKCLAMHKHRNQTLLNEIQSAIATTCVLIIYSYRTKLLLKLQLDCCIITLFYLK